ncbi:MAG: hypothetical protein UH853_05015 [Muribaculaceae bacterium]|nr:hypothetical protein [Muribaculaceae bacterium]
MQYVFKVTGKGLYGAPKGATVTVVKSNSTITMTEIREAFKRELGLTVSGSESNYDIKKMF